MTCVSERSGSASRAMLLMDQTPARIAAPVRTSTTNRLRAEKAMIRSIMVASVPVPGEGGRGRRRGSGRAGERALESGFGVDEEVGLSDDAFARLEALADLVPGIHAGARLHLPRYEAAAVPGHEDQRAGS